MSRVDYIAQPTTRTTLDAIERIMQQGGHETIDVAVAYITSGGAYDFLQRVSGALGAAWDEIGKRWITSFDYCRTEPVALHALMSIPNSSIRIHDAQFCLTHGGTPKVPFHPKAFLMRSGQRDYALAGSGNMSRSGLSKGVEAGLALEINRAPPIEPSAFASIQALRTWFTTTWASATPLNAHLLARYKGLFENLANLKAPVPTEDDIASVYTGSGALSSKDLQKLRVCAHFWIEAGNITKNRGPNLPGNQLMMKRLSRVFFGFSATTVSENTLIGTVDITFNNGAIDRYSLTYSDNKMDKLTLPIPANDGPPAYDNECLLFQRILPGQFRLTLGSNSDRATWLKKSGAIDGSFKMSSGRRWGVF
jgi:HKD family nuclease